MKSITKWLTAALAVLVVVLVANGAAALRAQEKPHGKPAMTKEQAAKAYAERIAMFKKTFPTAKVSLAAALATVEKQEAKSKIHSVEYTLTKEGKLTIEVGLLAGDKFAAVYVDPDTGKASAAKSHEEEEDDEEEGEEEDEEGEEHGKGGS